MTETLLRVELAKVVHPNYNGTIVHHASGFEIQSPAIVAYYRGALLALASSFGEGTLWHDVDDSRHPRGGFSHW